MFGSLLSISTIIDKINPALLHNVQYSCYTSLNGFPKPFTSDLNQLNVINQLILILLILILLILI